MPTLPQLQSWPLGGIDENGRLAHAQGDESVRQVLLNILLTRPGERLMRPEFGAGLLDFIHQPNNETTRQLMADVVRKSIAQWEPRIEIEGVDVVADPDNLAGVHVTVRYHLRHSVTPSEFTLALDLERVA